LNLYLMVRKNFSAKRNRKSNKTKKTVATSGYSQKATGAYHYTPRMGPIKARPIPSEFSISLVNTDYDSFANTGSYALRRFGIVEFLAYRPLYCLELYQIYKYARITAVQIELKVVNASSTTPLVLALGQCPYADSAGLTPDRAWETPGTRKQLVSVQGGMDRATIRKTFVGQNAYGQPYLDQKYWVDVSQSASTTPIDANEPIAYFMLSDYGGSGGVSARVESKITYHIQFFDLRIPSSSLETMDDQSFTIAQQSRTGSLDRKGDPQLIRKIR